MRWALFLIWYILKLEAVGQPHFLPWDMYFPFLFWAIHSNNCILKCFSIFFSKLFLHTIKRLQIKNISPLCQKDSLFAWDFKKSVSKWGYILAAGINHSQLFSCKVFIKQVLPRNGHIDCIFNLPLPRLKMKPQPLLPKKPNKQQQTSCATYLLCEREYPVRKLYWWNYMTCKHQTKRASKYKTTYCSSRKC